jgi:hypothetical protein
MVLSLVWHRCASSMVAQTLHGMSAKQCAAGCPIRPQWSHVFGRRAVFPQSKSEGSVGACVFLTCWYTSLSHHKKLQAQDEHGLLCICWLQMPQRHR